MRSSRPVGRDVRRAGFRFARWREAWALAALLGGAIALAIIGHAHYPIQNWLVWRYLTYWLICAAWAYACLSGGVALLRALRIELSAFERLLFAFAAGVVVFVWGMFLAGLAGMFQSAFALAWPCVLVAFGGKQAWWLVRGLRRAFQARRVGWPERAAAGFGVLGLAMIYFTILTPSNVGFDAQWYHLPIAEHYVAAGAIVPFEEGWFLGTYPHLASIVYGWGFLLPGTTPFDRVLVAAHLEFALFLATVFSIPLMVRRLVGGAAPRASWAALFLFPGIFLYDASLFVAADHVLAFWAIPTYLALVRAARRPNVRTCTLLAIVLAGALLTKYQAIYLLVPAAATMLYAAVRVARRGETANVALGFAAMAFSGLLLTAPHWLSNWRWYGDPFYPYLRHHLATHPWTPAALRDLESALQSEQWRPSGTAFAKLRETLPALFTFSFEPHDWATYHGSVPVFGSLFTVLSLLAPAVKRPQRILHAVASTLAGVAVWYLTFHQDRYLQALLPWMVSASVAIAHRVWSELPIVRPVLAALAFLQLLWGGDVYFMPANDDSHEIDRPSPVKAAVDLLASGHRGEYTKRLHPYETWEAIGAALPPKAKILLHERYLHLGLGAMSVSDLPGYQGGISYEDAATPADVFAMLSRLRVSHVLWETGTSHGLDGLAGDLAFFRFATQWTADRQSFGRFTVARMGARPPASAPGRVAWYDCTARRATLRPLADVENADGTPAIPMLDETDGPPHEADFVVMNRDCQIARPSPTFEHVADRGPYEFWTRRVDLSK